MDDHDRLSQVFRTLQAVFDSNQCDNNTPHTELNFGIDDVGLLGSSRYMILGKLTACVV